MITLREEGRHTPIGTVAVHRVSGRLSASKTLKMRPMMIRTLSLTMTRLMALGRSCPW